MNAKYPESKMNINRHNLSHVCISQVINNHPSVLFYKGKRSKNING